MHVALCLCAQIPTLALATRIVLVMHHREHTKTTASGLLALRALPNSELQLHGVRDAALDLAALHGGDRRVMVLFPSAEAPPLTAALLAADPRPVTLVVPDGSWRQASRAVRRIPGLERAERVGLVAGPPSQYGLRHEPKAGGLATFEAIARALGVLESHAVQARLEALFARMVEGTLSTRGRPVAPASQLPAAAGGEPLEILYRDDALVAVNKPAGVLVHRGWARDGVPALQRLRDQLGQLVYPVHRLDRATSGALLFALSPEIARALQKALRARAVDKRYLALCRGRDPSLTHVDHPLAKEPDAPTRPARTDLHLLGHWERYGLYEARPLTGRLHQIRRHLKHASHPIIGDVRYGKGEHNRLFRERFDFHRLALHAWQLRFAHPVTQEPLHVRAPLPPDFARLLVQLGLEHSVADAQMRMTGASSL
jgi:tRNA pseudouridine65 synthase